jgi:hypothetical protein
MELLRKLKDPNERVHRVAVALCIYVVSTTIFAIVAGPLRLGQHTQYNHYALLADAYLHGHQDIIHGGPSYAQGNDFAEFNGKTYISFPPFPAILMMPFVKLAGSAEEFRDGQFIVWLAGIAPAVLFLVLEKFRRNGRSTRTKIENIVLAFVFAFGTVYFFTAVEGTVWFAALVVGVGLEALFFLYAIDADQPLLAGAMIGFGFLTRPPLLLFSIFFGVEAIRVSCTRWRDHGSIGERVYDIVSSIDMRAFTKRIVSFSIPVIACIAFLSVLNHSRFNTWNPNVGHEYLQVAWHGRIEKWGLFGYHYLAKNLGVFWTILPWLPPKGSACFQMVKAPPLSPIFDFMQCVPFRINEHGLALWFTTPIYFWLFRPKVRSWHYWAIALTALLPLTMGLLYQNSGWRQFGFRFSNDYAVALFLLLAIGGRPMGRAFGVAAIWGIAWNLFGAVSFDRGDFDRFYFREGTQTILYQAD